MVSIVEELTNRMAVFQDDLLNIVTLSFLTVYLDQKLYIIFVKKNMNVWLADQKLMFIRWLWLLICDLRSKTPCWDIKQFPTMQNYERLTWFHNGGQ